MAVLGAVLVLGGERVDEGRRWIRRGHELFPSDLGILLLLAAAELHAGHAEAARRMAATVRLWSHRDSPESARAWRILLAIRGYEQGLDPRLLDFL